MASSSDTLPPGDSSESDSISHPILCFGWMKAEAGAKLEAVSAWLQKRAKRIIANLRTNHLWQRMLKNTLAVTITVILALIPSIARVYGKAMYLGCMTTVFGHPGRRFGQMAEALSLLMAGSILGVAWSMLGLYLSSLVYRDDSPAAYTIRGIFLAIAIFIHGFLRSHTPRLWTFVLLLAIVCVVSLTGTAKAVTWATVTVLLYPILTACGVLILVNILVFPEFASDSLGVTTINMLIQTVNVLRDAGIYFVSSEDGSPILGGPNTGNIVKGPPLDENNKAGQAHIAQAVRLKILTDSKAKLRSDQALCRAKQQELNFELAWSVLPPQSLRHVSDITMQNLVASVIALVGACESKYACIGGYEDEKTHENKARRRSKHVAEDTIGMSANPCDDVAMSNIDKISPSQRMNSRHEDRKDLAQGITNLASVQPRKEIESGDVELLKSLLLRVAKPISDLQSRIDVTVNAVVSCLACTFDVPKVPLGVNTLATIDLSHIDAKIEEMTDVLTQYDRDSAAALESAADLQQFGVPQVDIMPRIEVFLISSFLLNLRHAALHVLDMLRNSRELVEKYRARHGRKRIYAPKIKWRRWLASGGEQDASVMPENAKKDVRTGQRDEATSDNGDCYGQHQSVPDLLSGKEEQLPQRFANSTEFHKGSRQPYQSSFLSFRNTAADVIEYVAESEDFHFAFKLVIAIFLVVWPAFIARFNMWYSLNRGVWAALQLVLVTEVAIGLSVWTFVLRLIGTSIGCTWGWAAYEACSGNPYVIVMMLVVGIIPSTYIQLGSQYVKAGMVSIISMCIVALATADHTVPGSATENYLKRLTAFLIGGTVALVVEFVLLPVKARSRLVESIASSLVQITEMEACLAHGIEAETNVDVREPSVLLRFNRAKRKAQGALRAAETFLSFCGTEPRLKGSFRGLACIYSEILYVLYAIVDRMDNMLVLRTSYGSGVLEEINEEVYPYRRNVAGSMSLILFVVHEALVTKLPLPQFLPSARLAHIRMINRVREVLLTTDATKGISLQNDGAEHGTDVTIVERIVRLKFLSWNAASAGQVEVIEYLEELVDLTKLLVGAQEFRHGILTKTACQTLANHVDGRLGEDASADTAQEPMSDVLAMVASTGLRPTRGRAAAPPRSTEEEKKSEEQRAKDQLQDETDGLPQPLQRVRSRRIENLRLKLVKGQESVEQKPKQY